MPRYEIRAALGGGFGGVENVEWEPSDALTLDDAEKDAFQRACEVFESYEGMYGLRDVVQIMEEDSVDEDEAWTRYSDERDSWLDYDAREVTETSED